MKTLLLLILCFAIPLQGFAALAAFETHCPMEAVSMGSMDDADDPMMRDCCNDPDTVAKTGKLCKMGQECSSGAQCLLFPSVMSAVAPVDAERFSLISPFIPLLSAAGLWRPPTQL
jgi:hypothetical protein